MKKVLVAIAIVIAGVAILVGAVVGCAVWVYKDAIELRPVGATATFEESVDCLNRYVNNFSGWSLDNSNVASCFPTQTAATKTALIACFNTYERNHPDHEGWPEDNMRGCTWDGVTAVPAPHVVTLAFGEVEAVPAVPRAGERFALKVSVTRSDSAEKERNAPLDEETGLDVVVTIDGDNVGEGVVTPNTLLDFVYGLFPDSKIHVNFTLPESAEGERLTITMKIASHSPTATKVVTYTVVR